MLNFGRISGPAYEIVAVAVRVAVGGRDVAVGVGVELGMICVLIALVFVGRSVATGLTGMEVIVGLKTAVMVRSGVGKTIGVGAAVKGKLHAMDARINTLTTAVIMISFLSMLASFNQSCLRFSL
jgi:hypothetical protein